MNLITIAVFNNPHEAYLAKGKLDASGIHAELSNEFEVFANWLCTSFNCGIRLQVFDDQVENALELLKTDTQFPEDEQAAENGFAIEAYTSESSANTKVLL